MSRPEVRDAIVNALEEHPGGIGGVLQNLEKAGLGKEVRSWISSGPNQKIDPKALQDALGGTVGKVAAKMGVSTEEAAGTIGSILPQIVDRLTPGGKAPAGGLGGLGPMLKSLKDKLH